MSRNIIKNYNSKITTSINSKQDYRSEKIIPSYKNKKNKKNKNIEYINKYNKFLSSLDLIKTPLENPNIENINNNYYNNKFNNNNFNGMNKEDILNSYLYCKDPNIYENNKPISCSINKYNNKKQNQLHKVQNNTSNFEDKTIGEKKDIYLDKYNKIKNKNPFGENPHLEKNNFSINNTQYSNKNILNYNRKEKIIDISRNYIYSKNSTFGEKEERNEILSKDNDKDNFNKPLYNINCNINNINDLIELINNNKYDNNFRYNINLKALHNIKEPLIQLNDMIGMKELKNCILDQLLYFIQDLHKNNNHKSGDFLHTVIYGPPGTGKTEIAKLIGKIYSSLGILSKGTFKKVTRSDLIAGYLGQTALKTKEVIESSLGGVLFIDEAYALGNPDKKDSFSKECIDILCECLSDYKDNLMVIIAGYEKDLNESFFNYNPGLDSRFNWRFKTDNYDGSDLYKIFIKIIKEQGWIVNNEVLQQDDKIKKFSKNNITEEWFIKNKDYFKFYGRDIEVLITKTKIAHSRRVFSLNESEKKKLNLIDLENGFKIYLQNEIIKKRFEKEEIHKNIINSIYF
jgi:SpoVK/Ycf46/Vps4 family AAA+-type ATPase